MEVKGTVHVIGESKTISTNYEKRELIIKTDDQYPQLICIEFGQGKCNEYIDKLTIGQDVTVGINLKGREYNGKYYNSIQGWSVK